MTHLTQVPGYYKIIVGRSKPGVVEMGFIVSAAAEPCRTYVERAELPSITCRW